MDIKTLQLKDSQFKKGDNRTGQEYYQAGFFAQAISQLHEEIESNRIKFIPIRKISNHTRSLDDEKIIWYEITNSRMSNGNVAINNIKYFTSHYIGYYSQVIPYNTPGEQQKIRINISIHPRFGNEMLHYLLAYATGFYFSHQSISSSKKQSDAYWLIALMWKSSLEYALKKNHTPKAYCKVEKNIKSFKGKLKVTQHIHKNLTNQSNLYCQYRKLTMDVTINRVIRYVFQILSNKNLSLLIAGLAEYDQKLAAFGVQHKKVSIEEIKNIQYSKLNSHYKRVMDISELIISGQLASNDVYKNNQNSSSYFLDIAELWECYLLKLLKKNLPEYEIYSPNDTGGEHLINHKMREIRPDILIKKNNKIVAVLDAKFKCYNKLSSTSQYDGVTRDDLYQMMTYLFHYQIDNPIGIFISPVNNTDDYLYPLTKHKNIKIGVINLNIEQFSEENDGSNFNKEKIHQEENDFIDKIKKCIKS